MARRTRSAFLENRTARLKLASRKKPYTALIAPGIFLAYRRNAGPGTWSVKCNGWLKRFGLADDHEDANGESVMTYWQALDRAKTLARADEINTEQPIGVSEAVDAYEADLKTRGGRKYNATQLRLHLRDALKNKAVALLTERELRDWRAGLVTKGLKPSSADRIARSLKAALSLAARNDKRIANAAAWKDGLKKLLDSEIARNVILPDHTVAALVSGSYDEDRNFGLLVDVLAETGARESQIFNLTPDDLQDDNPTAPRLFMPTSKKGKNRKVEHRPLAISSAADAGRWPGCAATPVRQSLELGHAFPAGGRTSRVGFGGDAVCIASFIYCSSTTEQRACADRRRTSRHFSCND